MKNFNRKRAGVLLAAIALLLAAAVGGTVAFLVDRTGDVVNTFNPTKVSVNIDEKFDNFVKSDVKITNNVTDEQGGIAAYIRAKIVITWQDEDGNVYGQMPAAGTDYTITWGSETDWDIETSDGFYYHKAPVAPGDSTGVLIEKCEPVEANTPEGYNLHVEILAQGIQAAPTSVVAGEWGVNVERDETTGISYISK